MNFILQWLATSGKEMMSKVISAEATNHPLPNNLILHEDLSYKSPDGAALAGDLYRPKETTGDPLPIAIFVHGGGLFVGSRKAYRAYAELVAQRGYVVFLPEYRLISEADGIAEISDVVAGFAYVKDHAAEFGGDLSRVLVIGESAGGYLSLFATALLRSSALRDKLNIEVPDLTVRGLAIFGGMLYTTRFDIMGLVYRKDLYGERRHDDDFMDLLNPDNPRIEMYLPPVLQVSSGKDFLKSYTLRFNDTLTKTGHDHRLILYKHGKELTHAFPSLQPGLPQSLEIMDQLDAWFRGL